MSDPIDLTKFEAVVFDMDGTLIDSEGYYCEAYMHAMHTLGGSLTAEEYYRRFSGFTDDAIDRILHAELDGQVELSVIRTTWYCEYNRLREERGVPLMPGAGELLDRCEGAGLAMAVASAAGLRDIEFNLETARIRHRFAVFSSGEEVAKTKPAPDVYLQAAERLDVAPNRCLAFEDTNTGCRAAIAAGMQSYMVPYRSEPEDFVRTNASGVFSSLTEVVEWLR